MTRHPSSLMSLSGNGRKSLAFRLILQYYKLEIRNKLLLNPNIEYRNPKQIQNSNAQIFKTDSKTVILSERPASEESLNRKQDASLRSA